MRKLVINGGKPLKGEVTISGAKNSTVALIPAAVIAEEPVVLEGVPDIQDVAALIEILNDFNVKTEYVDGTLTIDPTEMKSIPMPKGKIQSMRASYYFMGATLAKFGEGVVGLPGGCFLGPRPIDQHLKGFKALGANVVDHDGAIYLSTDEEGLVGTKIYMDVVSVGATIDRKSKRLNSSHLVISYAVFCLKKKNTFLFGVIIFFFNDPATTEIYTLSLHDALPISAPGVQTW